MLRRTTGVDVHFVPQQDVHDVVVTVLKSDNEAGYTFLVCHSNSQHRKRPWGIDVPNVSMFAFLPNRNDTTSK